VQKITRTQRRFDSAAFIDYVKSMNDSDIELDRQVGINFIRLFHTVEYKPFNADYDVAIKKDLGGFDVK
jgi:hypothetical protein